MSGIEIQVNDEDYDDEGRALTDEVRTTGATDSAPGIEFDLEPREQPVGLDPNAEPFPTEEAMSEALSRRSLTGRLLIETNAEYRREVESRTVASMGAQGPWGDAAFTGGKQSQPQPQQPKTQQQVWQDAFNAKVHVDLDD